MSANLLLSVEVSGYPVDAEAELIAIVAAFLRSEGLYDDFNDSYHFRFGPLRRVVDGERILRGGTPYPVIISGAGRWNPGADLHQRVTARVPEAKTLFDTADADVIEPWERFYHLVVNHISNRIEGARAEVRDSGALADMLRHYPAWLPCWEQRAALHHLLMDQDRSLLVPLWHDLLQAPLDRQNTGLHYAQVDAVEYLGKLASSDGFDRLAEKYDLLERCLGFLRQEIRPLPLDELEAASYAPAGDDEARFLAARGDDTSRQVYADWLEQRGDAARAEYVRIDGDPSQRRRREALELELDPIWMQAVRR